MNYAKACDEYDNGINKIHIESNGEFSKIQLDFSYLIELYKNNAWCNIDRFRRSDTQIEPLKLFIRNSNFDGTKAILIFKNQDVVIRFEKIEDHFVLHG
jgi:hypothetical protein